MAMEASMPKALILGGATGLLGRPLTAAMASAGWETESLGREDGDLLTYEFLKSRLNDSKPDVVFNTVAWTQVDDAEDHPEEAAKVNRCLPDALSRIIASMPGVWFGHVSTDFVFSAPPGTLLKETDEPNPESVYGETKLAGEKAIAHNLPDRSCIIRTAWLFGPGKKNFVKTILNACHKKSQLNVVDDQTGSPTYTLDLAQWAVALTEKRMTGIWHAVNSGQASWWELAAEASQLIPESCRVMPITTAEWPQKAKRPANSALDNTKLANFLGQRPRAWPKALRDYVYGEFQAEIKEER